MTYVGIVLSQDELVRLYEVAGRLTAGGDWLGDLAELWTEFRSLVFGHIIVGDISPELIRRLDNVLPTLRDEIGQVEALEAAYEGEATE